MQRRRCSIYFVLKLNHQAKMDGRKSRRAVPEHTCELRPSRVQGLRVNHGLPGKVKLESPSSAHFVGPSIGQKINFTFLTNATVPCSWSHQTTPLIIKMGLEFLSLLVVYGRALCFIAATYYNTIPETVFCHCRAHRRRRKPQSRLKPADTLTDAPKVL